MKGSEHMEPEIWKGVEHTLCALYGEEAKLPAVLAFAQGGNELDFGL